MICSNFDTSWWKVRDPNLNDAYLKRYPTLKKFEDAEPINYSGSIASVGKTLVSMGFKTKNMTLPKQIAIVKHNLYNVRHIEDMKPDRFNALKKLSIATGQYITLIVADMRLNYLIYNKGINLHWYFERTEETQLKIDKMKEENSKELMFVTKDSVLEFCFQLMIELHEGKMSIHEANAQSNLMKQANNFIRSGITYELKKRQLDAFKPKKLKEVN